MPAQPRGPSACRAGPRWGLRWGPDLAVRWCTRAWVCLPADGLYCLWFANPSVTFHPGSGVRAVPASALQPSALPVTLSPDPVPCACTQIWRARRRNGWRRSRGRPGGSGPGRRPSGRRGETPGGHEGEEAGRGPPTHRG